jgi:hypothetical protein
MMDAERTSQEKRYLLVATRTSSGKEAGGQGGGQAMRWASKEMGGQGDEWATSGKHRVPFRSLAYLKFLKINFKAAKENKELVCSLAKCILRSEVVSRRLRHQRQLYF